METWGQIVSMQLTVVGLHLNLGDAAIVVTYVRHVVTLKSTHYAINKITLLLMSLSLNIMIMSIFLQTKTKMFKLCA